MDLSKADERQPRLPVQQLAILSLCRFAEPIALTGVFPYLPEMIESFDVPQNDVAFWAGITSLVFSLAQAVTSIQWGRASDYFGRKPMILLALTWAMLTSLLFGFSQNLVWAIIARALAGASNGNVGILRTTVAELVPQKSLQPVAFAVMPMMWAIGSSVGPVLGGKLAVPTRQFPSLFAGNDFFERYKFALPNMVASVFFTIGILSGFLFLRETLETKKGQKDYGLMLGRQLTGLCRRRRLRLPQTPIIDQESVPTSPRLARKHSAKLEPAPGWIEVFTRQSTLNIISYTLVALHAVTFDQLVPVFLHYPPQNHSPESGNVHLPFKFSGGLGLDSGYIGTLFMVMGLITIVVQFAVFPPVTRRFGALRCFQVVTFIFPIVHFLVPYSVLLSTPRLRIGAVFSLMILKTCLSTFAFPCTTILLTNSASSLRVLGTLNGAAVATSALGRASGPFIGGGMFTWGVDRGYVVVPWYILGFSAVLGHISTWWLVDGDGPSGALSESGEDGDEDSHYDAGESSDNEEIVLLPSEHEANAGQATGVILENDNRWQQDSTRFSKSPYKRESVEPLEGGDDRFARLLRDAGGGTVDDDSDGGDDFPTSGAGGERSPLLGTTAPLRRISSRESRINIGGASLTRRASRTHSSDARVTSPAADRLRRPSWQPSGAVNESVVASTSHDTNTLHPGGLTITNEDDEN